MNFSTSLPPNLNPLLEKTYDFPKVYKFLKFRVVVFKFVIPAPIFIGINSSRACPALDAGNPDRRIYWNPVPRFREDKFHGNDTLMLSIK